MDKMDKIIYISYLDPKFVSRYNDAVKLDNQYLIRILTEKSNQGNMIFKGWVESKGASVIQASDGAGIVEMYPSYIEELSQKWREYDKLIETHLCIGVGKTLQEAEAALETIRHHHEGGIVFYSDALNHCAKKDCKPQTIEEVVNHELLKAEDESSKVDMKEMADHLHGHAKKDQDSQASNLSMKSAIVESLNLLKENMPMIKQIKEKSPDLYQAIVNLSKIVVQLGQTLTTKVDKAPEAKKASAGKTPKATENKEGKVKVYHPKTHRVSWRKMGAVSGKEKDPGNTTIIN